MSNTRHKLTRHDVAEIAVGASIMAAVASGGVFRTYERVGISLQEQLREVGIRVEVKPLESGLVGRRLRNGEFDAAMRIFSTYPAASPGRSHRSR